MALGRRPSIPQDVFEARLSDAFKGFAVDTGTMPSVDDAIAYDIAQGNQPPLPRASVFRRLNALTEGNPEVDTYGLAVAYAGQIGIRSAVQVDGEFYVHQASVST